MVSRITFQNFRNFQSLDLNTSQGFVVLAGPNGAGKTNFLEGLYFGLNLKKFPESKLGQLFREGDSFFRIRIASPEDSFEIYYQTTDTGFAYKLKLNNQAAARPKYAGVLPAISFLPQDLNLLTRSPGGRRRFLNEVLSLVSAEYRHNLFQYEKALRQYRELLEKIKQGGSDATLEIWEQKMTEHGVPLAGDRADLLDYLNANMEAVLAEISPNLAGTKLMYQKHTEGPHRDDFSTLAEGKDAVGFLSRGQMRAITLTLKILEKQFIKEKNGKSPILLLDDVFSEFDHEHQKKLLEFLKSFEQVFVTTAHPEEIEKFLPEGARILQIKNGVIENV